MLALHTFGSTLALFPGAIPTITIITIGAAVFASGGDLVQKILAGETRQRGKSLGASGVVMGLGTVAAALRRKYRPEMPPVF